MYIAGVKSLPVTAMHCLKMLSAVAILAMTWVVALAFSQQTRPRYTTLVVQFVGEMDRPVSPIVISTTSDEAEWYKQQLFKKPIGVLVDTEVVPTSVLNKIAGVPLLSRALERAKPEEEESRTTPTVRFVAGRGRDYAQIVLDAQTSTKILANIDKHVTNYPELQGQIREIESLIAVR